MSKVDVTGSNEGGSRVFFPRYVDAGVRVSDRRAGANALLPILIQYSSQMRHVPRRLHHLVCNSYGVKTPFVGSIIDFQRKAVRFCAYRDVIDRVRAFFIMNVLMFLDFH